MPLTEYCPRRGRPTIAQRELGKWTEERAQALLSVTLTALILKEKHVKVLAPYNMKFPKGFPRSWGTKRVDDGHNLYSFVAKALLDWYRDNGYTSITLEDIRVAKIANYHKEKEIDDPLRSFGSS